MRVNVTKILGEIIIKFWSLPVLYIIIIHQIKF